jgi:Tol biopolymer transport system component
MQNKQFLAIIIMVVGIPVIGLIAGCAENYYSVKSYYYPDWTPDGKIICVKKVDNYRSGGGYPSFGGASLLSTNYYITTMNDEGTQEADVKQINSLDIVDASPLGNYIAYIDSNYIRILTSGGTDFASINIGEPMGSLDWSPNEDKLLFSTNGVSWESFMIDMDGQNKRNLFVGITPSWSNDGSKIVFNRYFYSGDIPVWDGLFIYDVTSEVSTRVTSGEGGDPKYLPGDEFIIFDSGRDFNIKEKNVLTDETVQILDEEVFFPRWSPLNIKILYGAGANQGIWTSKTDGNDFKQLK